MYIASYPTSSFDVIISASSSLYNSAVLSQLLKLVKTKGIVSLKVKGANENLSTDLKLSGFINIRNADEGDYNI